MVAPLIAAYAPYLPALGHQVLRYWPNITRFGGQAAAQANNLFRTISSGTQKLGQLMYSPPVSQSLIQQGPLLSPFLGAGVESFMMNSPKPPSPPPSQESPIPTPPPSPSQESPIPPPYPVPETFLNKKSPEDLKPKVDVPQAQPLETSSQIPPREPTDVEKFLQSNTYKFFQSDAYQKLKDLFAGMAESSSGGSGWDALASGVKRLNEGDKQRGQVNQTVEYLKSKGYSEEEARFMAGNKDALNAFLAQTINGGNRNPQFTNDGRMLVEDPNAPGGYRYVTVEGGKAHEDMQKREQLKKLQIVDAKIMRESTAYTINEALEILKKNPKASTGAIGQFLQYLWNTPASRLKNHLEAIRGGVMLHKLERIKALSPNGASGLGNLTDREGKNLESVYGALQQSSSPKDLIKNLQRLQEIYNKATDAQIAILMNDNITAADVDEAFGSSAQHSIDSPTLTGKYAGVSFITTNEEIQKLPKGSKFAVRTHDGIRIYER